MSTDLLLYLDNDITDADLSFMDSSIPKKIMAFCEKSNQINSYIISAPMSYKGSLTEEEGIYLRSGDDDVEFWKNLFEKTKSNNIIKVYADSPFLDISIIEEMIELHNQYLAEFTFSENLPSGLTCEIISKELIQSIPEFNEKTLPLSQVIKTNINQFDIELFYKDPDIRDKRISFRNSNKRDKKIMENLYQINNNVPEYAKIKDLIETNPQVLYIGPSYLEIELTGKADHTCIFSYADSLKRIHDDISIDLLKKIIDEMRSFNLPYTVCLGGSGDPLMHPRVYEALDLLHTENIINNIIVETDGILADTNYLQYLEKQNPIKIKTIINVNGFDEKTYKAIHGSEKFNIVLNNISALSELNKKNNNELIYLQIMKINETEEFLDRYYDFWENYSLPIILQKQNTYLGKIEDRRYSDLSPLERTPCWHLQRDLYIISNGQVGFCKQDPDGDYAKGDINHLSISEIWNNGLESFLNDYKKHFSTCPDCQSCDEWYTFNF